MKKNYIKPSVGCITIVPTLLAGSDMPRIKVFKGIYPEDDTPESNSRSLSDETPFANDDWDVL